MDQVKVNNQLVEWFKTDLAGYSITLNAVTKDKISFEQDLRKVAHYLNDYCLGRAYKRREKRLKIIGGIETGKQNGILHAHLCVNHQSMTQRSFQDINFYLRKQWYKLIQQNNIFGNMVDVRPIYDVTGAIGYLTKDSQYWDRLNDQNILLL